jgi:hypothetical protein
MKHRHRFAPKGGRIESKSVASFVGISTGCLTVYKYAISDLCLKWRTAACYENKHVSVYCSLWW